MHAENRFATSSNLVHLAGVCKEAKHYYIGYLQMHAENDFAIKTPTQVPMWITDVCKDTILNYMGHLQNACRKSLCYENTHTSANMIHFARVCKEAKLYYIGHLQNAC